ncbi:MAG: sugar ABC transporter permease [Deltaproteobacteria bacterium]|nr:sugar ABC transporter permease [Deltaproteobacteria bacterium]
MFIFIIVILVRGFLISLTDAQGFEPGEFIGLENFKEIIKDDWFWKSVINTSKFAVACILTQIPAGLLLASGLNQIRNKKLQGMLAAAFFIPYLMNSVIIAQMFNLLFSGEPGLVNWFLGLLHLPNDFQWTFDPHLSFPLLVFVAFWQGVGLPTIYFLTYYRTIDPMLYEAAAIDGATPFRKFFCITLPLMRPAILFMVVTTAASCMLIFDLVFMLFRRGVGENVVSIIMYIYWRGFSGDFELGVAAAAGWLAFFIILTVSLIQIKVIGLGKPNEN